MASGLTLRPLSVGEIFDRALTVYVKNWLPFSVLALIFAAATIPEYYSSGSAVEAYDLHPASPAAQAPMLSAILAVLRGGANHENPVLLWSGVCGRVLLHSFLYPAFAVGYVQIAQGGTPKLSEWIAPALSRAGRLLGLFLLWALAFLGGTAAVGLVIAVLVIPLALARSTPLFTGLVIAVVVIPFLAVVVAVSITAAWSGFIAVVEDRRILDSFRAAQRRSLGRGRFWRTLGIGTALSLLGILIVYVIRTAAASVLIFSKSPALFAVVNALLSIPIAAFGPIVIAAYYVDSRIRDGELGQGVDGSLTVDQRSTATLD